MLGIGALIFKGKRILLAQRGKQPLLGWWSLPGGVLETGESLVDGIRREVREETGLEVKPLEIATVFERIIPDGEGRAEYHYVLIDYVCRVVGGTAAPASDVSALAWVREEELERYQLTEGTLPVIREAFRKRREKKS
ncbi:MAG: NUDIX hydrolase [Acidobacteria bacterium]|nr:NUDIX hydrolase [Acidobacteriota bacterium]